MIRKIACILSWLSLASTILYAQNTAVPLGRWNKVEREQPGTGIVVSLHGGEVIECFYKSLSADTLTVLTDNVNVRDLPKSSVAKIVTREKRSGPLWNGAVIGAAIPATLGIIGCSSYNGRDKGACFAVTAIWSGIGAGIGVGIDALVKGRITLYEAPAQNK